MSAYPVFYGEVKSPIWYLLYYGKYLLSLSFILYSFTKRKSDANAVYLRKKFNRNFVLCPIVILAYSICIWTLNTPSFNFITRGISNTLFNCISYATGIAIACSLKEETPKCAIIAALTVYCISIFLGLLHGGGDFLKNCLFLRSTSAQGAYTELHEVAFVIGLYLLFLLFMNKKRFIKNTRCMTIMCILFYIIAWKRIGLAAFIFVALYIIIIRRKTARLTSKLMYVTGIVTIAICLIYVAFSTSDNLILILNRQGIDMMGRNIIYSYFRRFCDFTPLFLGRGVGFVSRQFDYATEADLYNMVSIKALHNDLMKMYIEVGFAGFVVWCYYWLINIPKKIVKYANVQAGFYSLCLLLFAFITYTTDNTGEYYNFQMHLIMLLYTISYYFRKKLAGLEHK